MTINNFRFKFDYCNNSNRVRFQTTIDSKLLDDLKYIKKNTNNDISKLIEVALAEQLKSQESFNRFLELCKTYEGYETN